MPTDVSGVLVEALTAGSSDTKVSGVLVEALTAGSSDTKVSGVLTEALTAHGTSTRASSILVEALVAPAVPFNGVHGILIECLVAPLAVSSITLPIENNVNPTDKYVPLTGLYSTEETITGWLWDRRRLENERFLQTQYDTFLGGHEAGLTDGTILEHWESGSNRGTEYKDIAHYRKGEFLTWTPRVDVGAYSLYHDRRPLYSDYSFSDNFSTDAIDQGAMWHELRSDALHSTIDVAMYARDDASRIFRKTSFERVENFTGIFSGSERVSTVDGDGNLLFNNFETRKDEFIIKDGRVWLNDDYSLPIGQFIPSASVPEVPITSYSDFLEPAGQGVREGRDIFTRFFPVQPASVRVRVQDAAQTIDEWTEQDNLDFSVATDKHFSVDYDLGIITMGGFQAPDLTLSADVDETDVEIMVYVDDETMDQYPQQGIIVIDSEQIAYFSRTRNVFYNVLRGFNDTIAASHGIGATVQDIQHGAGTDDELFVSYIAVPRIDYEVTEWNFRSANKSPWLDIRPGANVETHNILQILSADINLQEVILETDTPLIGGELHGPLFFGTDVSRLTARGLDALGNPVEDVDLTIDIISGPGLLNGAGTSFTDISNTLGEIYAFYNTPFDKDEIEKTVSSVTHVGADTQMVVDGLVADTPTTDIWVFQILKHDKITGTVGLQLEVTDADASPGSFILLSPGYIEVDGLIDPELFKDGHLIVVGTDSISYVRNIVAVVEEEDGSGQPFSRIYMDNTLSSALVTGQTVRLYEPEAVEWNPAALNGTRHIVYEFRSDIPHPISGELGAFYPLQPDSISGNTMTFLNRNLPLPDKDDTTNNLGAYVVVATGRAALQASGRDPISGRVVRSNIVRLQLELPNSLVGVDTSGVLPIPIGWTFVTEEFNVGAAIGGANFITINPAADGINQFSLLGIFP